MSRHDNCTCGHSRQYHDGPRNWNRAWSFEGTVTPGDGECNCYVSGTRICNCQSFTARTDGRCETPAELAIQDLAQVNRILGWESVRRGKCQI